MKKLVTLMGIVAMLEAGLAVAECPTTLSEKQFNDCIVSEGAGQSYQEYQKETELLEQEILSQREASREKAAASHAAAKVK